MAALNKMGKVPPTKTQVKAIFNDFDQDHNGVLNFDEFKAML